MIGQLQVCLETLQLVEKIAHCKAPVLIEGETGTGKELLTNILHYNSNRSKLPLIKVSCAILSREIFESELFGHEKGAFTSAVAQRKGKFELAEGGTIFLDEIGDMSLSAQAKVLRALQENKITRVGSEKEVKVNVRVLAATNKELQKEISKGNFREDLYHRLSVIIIKVPSLNERKDDIPLLVEHFSKMICEEQGIPQKTFSKDALKELQKVNWTGNIRELRNVVERLIILGDKTISAKDVITFAQPLKS